MRRNRGFLLHRPVGDADVPAIFPLLGFSRWIRLARTEGTCTPVDGRNQSGLLAALALAPALTPILTTRGTAGCLARALT